jgi:hypothetical protein
LRTSTSYSAIDASREARVRPEFPRALLAGDLKQGDRGEEDVRLVSQSVEELGAEGADCGAVGPPDQRYDLPHRGARPVDDDLLAVFRPFDALVSTPDEIPRA